MEKAHKRNILTTIERVSNKHHPLSTECFKHQASIEFRKIATVWLPPPMLVIFVGSPMFLASQLWLYVRTL
uniref:Transmembrane protein n=1 Tax=Medicago truncatula TaxID=3880 RepID=I3SGU6_MEDTR|nr:unknown [Medicago truncatula]